MCLGSDHGTDEHPSAESPTDSLEEVFSPASTQFLTPREELEDHADASINQVHQEWRRYTDHPNDICYRCFMKGRKAPNCPCQDRSDKDPYFARYCKRNYDALSAQQNETLASVGRSPRWIILCEDKAQPNYAPPDAGNSARKLAKRSDDAKPLK